MLQFHYENLSLENKQLCMALRLYLSQISPTIDNIENDPSLLIVRSGYAIGNRKKTSIDLRPVPVGDSRVISSFSKIPCIEGCIAARHILP